MTKSSWNLETLRNTLSQRNEIKSWIVSQENVRRRERYFMLDQGAFVVDQDRDINSQSITAKIMVQVGRDGRQGEITKKLFPALPLKEQLDSAIEAARQTDHQAWELPTELPSSLPRPKTVDPRIAEDINAAMNGVTARIERFVRQARPTTFNSAELFMSVHDRELHLSNGLHHRSSQSRVYSEAAYSFENTLNGERRSDEYLNTRWAVNLDDLQIEELLEQTSDRAQSSLEVQKPLTGKYPVIVDAEVLATLFNGHLGQLSGGNAYHSLPHVKPGEPLIPGAKGDLITLTLDPLLDFGADTISVSDQGMAQNPLKLVENNMVLASAMDKQYADYLGAKPTTARGNIVIAPGKLDHRDLTQQAPKVLEILQFSALFADPNGGTFSSEIRLAKLYDNTTGETRFIKGGSLSGSITENFSNARFSRQLVNRAHFSSNASSGNGYYGPEYALLNDVSIVG